MPTVSVQVVWAFTSNGAGGNPAGVVYPADGLSPDMMQQVAAKLGLSETAFISGSDSAGFRLDFFTPNRRIAHCGHATVAAFSYLLSLNEVGDGETSKETVDGVRRIRIDRGQVYLEQLAPDYEPIASDSSTGQSILASLGLAEADLIPNCPPCVVDTGNRFLLIGLSSRDRLAAIEPDQAAIERVSSDLSLIGYYVFARTEAAAQACTRMFAPLYGIPEEAATGMAAGPLACLMQSRLGVDRQSFVISQGDLMAEPSPSLLRVELEIEDGDICRLWAGGNGSMGDRFVVEI